MKQNKSHIPKIDTVISGKPFHCCSQPSIIPLSWTQYHLFKNREQKNSTFAKRNFASMLWMSGAIDAPALKHALCDVIKRHEILHTTYADMSGEYSPIILKKPISLNLHQNSVPTMMDAMKDIPHRLQQSFDLTKEIPIKAYLYDIPSSNKLLPDYHLLLVLINNVACDAISLEIFVHDLSEAYAACLNRQSPEWDSLPMQYADFAIWQRHLFGEASAPHSLLAKGLAFHLNQISGLIEKANVENQPIHSEAEKDFKKTFIRFNPGIHRGLLEIAGKEDSGLLSVMHAAFAIVLSKQVANANIPICFLNSGRHSHDHEQLIGLFENLQVICINVSGNPRFHELHQRVQNSHRALSKYNVSFDQLESVIDPVLSQTVGQSALILRSFPQTKPTFFPGVVNLKVSTYAPPIGNFNLMLDLFEHHSEDGKPGGIEGSIKYRSSLFGDHDISLMVNQLYSILLSVSADPTQRIQQIECAPRTSEIPRISNEIENSLKAIDSQSSTKTEGDSDANAEFAISPNDIDYAWNQSYIKPNEILQSRLSQVWEELFGVYRIGLRDSFWSLGGTKQLGKQLIRTVEKCFGKKLSSFIDINKYTTIETLSIAMIQLMPLSPIIKVRKAKSDAPPIFFFHGDIFGSGWYSFELSRRLGSGQSFFSLPPHGINGYIQPDSIQKMAQDDLKHLLKIRPQGPYLFFGFCNGAIVALEMAHIMKKRGQEVPFLVLIEPPVIVPPGKSVILQAQTVSAQAEKTQYLQQASTYKQKVPIYFDLAKSILFYRTEHYPGTIHLIKGRESEIKYEADEWSKIADKIQLHLVPSDHTGCTSRHLPSLVKELKVILNSL
jgi:surfactin synthase thioesterase subunit